MPQTRKRNGLWSLVKRNPTSVKIWPHLISYISWRSKLRWVSSSEVFILWFLVQRHRRAEQVSQKVWIVCHRAVWRRTAPDGNVTNVAILYPIETSQPDYQVCKVNYKLWSISILGGWGKNPKVQLFPFNDGTSHGNIYQHLIVDVWFWRKRRESKGKRYKMMCLCLCTLLQLSCQGIRAL